jgi:hypothetical protein
MKEAQCSGNQFLWLEGVLGTASHQGLSAQYEKNFAPTGHLQRD